MISVCVMIQKGHIQCEKISLALKKQPYVFEAHHDKPHMGTRSHVFSKRRSVFIPLPQSVTNKFTTKIFQTTIIITQAEWR